MFRTIISMFRLLFPAVPRRSEQDRKIKERTLVGRYSHGSIYLQSGKYLTAKDAERQRKVVATYTFT